MRPLENRLAAALLKVATAEEVRRGSSRGVVLLYIVIALPRHFICF